MRSALTDHVRNFQSDSDPAQEVLGAVERLLRYRMREKGLLSLPPSQLGYPGVASWSARDAFEDIVVDCYIFAILDRLAALKNQLRIKPNVDGLISRNVAHFLIERRRRCDPIGYAVFGTVCGAVREALAAQLASVDQTDSDKLTSQTVLRLTAEPQTASPAAPDVIQSVVATAGGWSDVVPHLTETTEEGRGWISSFLRELSHCGVSALRLGDLAAALSGRVRADWHARHADADATGHEFVDDVTSVVRIVWPDRGLESRDRWGLIKTVVPRRIARLDRQERVRTRLATVFAALVAAIEGGDSPPSQADLISATGVPRATLSDDFRILREILSRLDDENPE